MKKIAIVGLNENETKFLFDSVTKIIELSGNKEDVSAQIYDPIETPREINPDLIFTQMSDADIWFARHAELRDFLKWVRNNRNAYCMVTEEHPAGLHNYNNFRSLIVPMNAVFKPLVFDKDKEGKPISPAVLIEAMRPPKDEQKG